MKDIFSRREKVLYDVVLNNGERVAELLPHLTARGFARVWNRLPRTRQDRAYVRPVRFVELLADD